MAKKSYRIMAFVWDKRCREYTPETIAVIKDYGDAMIAFGNLKASKDMPQIEIFEQTLGKHDFVQRSELLRLKDTTGEYDGQSV